MKVLIKLGGTLLDAPDLRARLAAEIAQAVREGLEAVVVHGGGKQMTRYLADRGIESTFVNGLRVTTPEVLDAVLKVFAGTVNKELVAALIAAGAPAVGLSGMDALLTEAVRMSEELGFVGKPVQSNAKFLNLLTANSYLPVVACVAGDRQGRFYNVNADQMAVSLAAAIRAEKLLFLTDVEGVRGPDNKIYSTLDLNTCHHLIANETATGGMRAKLESAMEAIKGGLCEVVIAPGATPGIVAKLIQGEKIGTRLGVSTGAPTHGRFGHNHPARLPAELTVRKARMADIPGLLQLINEYAARGIMLPRTEFELSENIRDFTVLYSGSQLLACGALHFYTPTSGEVRSLAVSPATQHAGLGRRVVAALELEAIDNDLHAIFAFTYVTEFFLKIGFHEVERGELPLKVWKDCLRCPKFQCCDEVAVIKQLIGHSLLEPSTEPDLDLVQLPTLKNPFASLQRR